MTHILRDRGIGLLNGLLYAVAVSIHLDPLCWAVGIYDIGGACFFLLAIWFFIRERPKTSVACFLAGVLFKESVMVLPLIIAGLLWYRYRSGPWKERGCAARQLLPHIGGDHRDEVFRRSFTHSVAAFPSLCDRLRRMARGNEWQDVFIMDVPGVVALRKPRHTISSCARTVRHSGRGYAQGGGKAAPAGSLKSPRLPGEDTAASPSAPESATGLLLIWWVLAALLPVLFLPNHAYRYYATYALPAFLSGTLILGRRLLAYLGFNSTTRRKLLVAAAVIAMCLSIIQANRIFSQGLRQSLLSDGMNGLVRRGAIVNIAQRSLLRLLPKPPDQAVLVLGGVDVCQFRAGALHAIARAEWEWIAWEQSRHYIIP
jgi:hypothetical protein